MENEYKKQISFTKEEFDYIKNLLHGLSNVENKIPKGMKSRKSEILKELNSRFSRMSFNE